MHAALAARPWVAEVVTSDGFLSRAGASASWFVEAMVGGALDAGCSPEQAVLVFRNLWYFTVGEILVRARSADRQAADDRRDSGDAVFRTPDPSLRSQHAHRPNLAAVADLWVEVSARDTFTEGLRALVGGLLASASGNGLAPKPGG